jgi:hypothetical protein
MTRAPASATAYALLALGCVDAELCRQDSESIGQALGVEDRRASTRLGLGGQLEGTRFRASLSGLPELWPGESTTSGNLGISFTLAYEGEPRGSDGRTEMPRVLVAIDPARRHHQASAETRSYANAEATNLGIPFFEVCSDDPEQVNCCPFGVRECTLPFRVTLERLDGEPFPPVVVDWSMSLSARVSSCDWGDRPEPALTLEQELP